MNIIDFWLSKSLTYIVLIKIFYGNSISKLHHSILNLMKLVNLSRLGKISSNLTSFTKKYFYWKYLGVFSGFLELRGYFFYLNFILHLWFSFKLIEMIVNTLKDQFKNALDFVVRYLFIYSAWIGHKSTKSWRQPSPKMRKNG